MTSRSWNSWLGAPLIAFVLTVAPSVSPVHAVEDAHKVSVVSFGLFGDQGVFRSDSKAWPWRCKRQPMGWMPRTTFCF